MPHPVYKSTSVKYHYVCSNALQLVLNIWQKQKTASELLALHNYLIDILFYLSRNINTPINVCNSY